MLTDQHTSNACGAPTTKLSGPPVPARFAARRARPARRSGVTLIELLAVIIILLTLAAAAIPIIQPVLANRAVREAARMTSSFITGARNRAMQSGRPVGVVLQRMPGLPEASITLSYAEVPLPYSGDSTDSWIAINGNTITGLTPAQDPMTGAFTQSRDFGWQGLVRPGDLLKLNFQGHVYQLTGPANAVDSQTGYYNKDPVTVPWTIAPVTGTALPPSGDGRRYQIIRQPVKLAAGALQLPDQTVIDLTCSGFDAPDGPLAADPGLKICTYVPAYSFQPIWPQPLPYPRGSSPAPANKCPFNPARDDNSSIMITFAPSGAVDALWCWGNDMAIVTPGTNPTPIQVKPLSPIHLMVGRRDLLPLPTSPPNISNPSDPNFKPYANWQDLTNFWVSINPQSGLVSTVENSPYTDVWNSNEAPYGTFNELLLSRRLARESQRMGGR